MVSFGSRNGVVLGNDGCDKLIALSVELDELALHLEDDSNYDEPGDEIADDDVDDFAPFAAQYADEEPVEVSEFDSLEDDMAMAELIEMYGVTEAVRMTSSEFDHASGICC